MEKKFITENNENCKQNEYLKKENKNDKES